MMKRLIILLMFLLSLLLSLSLSTSIAAIAHPSSVFASLPHGYAFAGYAETPVGPNLAVNGPISPSWVGCNASNTTVTNSAVNMSLASYVNTGTVQTTITATRNSNSASVSTTSDVKNLSILRGLITASDVKAVGTSTATSNGATSTTVGTNFAGLKVAGISISGTPQPNTTIQLPSLGYVVLNEEGFNNGIDAT